MILSSDLGLQPDADLVQTAAIQQGLQQVSDSVASHTLVLEPGHYRSGGLMIPGNVTLHFESGQSLAGTPNPRKYEQDDFEQHPIWTAGYIEHSFPYFEHGMFVRQPAGWHIVKHEGGGVTLAMTMFFSHWQQNRNLARHGNFSDRNLSVLVSLHPDSRSYQVETRVDNPNPLARSERVWSNHHLHTEAYDDTHLIFPAGYVSTHSVWWTKPFWIAPFWAPDGERWHRHVSLFGVFSEYGFAGMYSPQNDNNSLIVKDPKRVPGLKLYTGDNGFFEIWTGSTTLFEHPGAGIEPYRPVRYTHHWRDHEKHTTHWLTISG